MLKIFLFFSSDFLCLMPCPKIALCLHNFISRNMVQGKIAHHQKVLFLIRLLKKHNVSCRRFLEIHENFKFLPVLNNTNTNFVTVFFKPLIHRRPFLASFLHDFHTLISWVTLLSWLLYCKKKRQFGGKVEWCTSYLPMGGKDQIIVPIPYCLQRKSECTYILTPHVYGSFINYVDMVR